MEAQCNKHNIEEALKLEQDTKRDGTPHKTKNKQRATIINKWKKEQKQLRDFFLSHQKERDSGDYKNYKFRRGITDNRQNLNGDTSS